MRRSRFVALGLVGLAGAVLLPATGGAQTARRLFLPMVPRETPPTPTPAPNVPIRLRYRAYLTDRGWTDWQDEGAIAGGPQSGKPVEAIQIELASAPPGVSIRYRAWQIDRGISDWAGPGGTAGVVGSRVEGLQVALVNAPANTYVSTETYAAEWGWLGHVRDNWVAGTNGQLRPIEAFRAHIRTGSPEPANIGIAYTANVQSVGWMGWRKDGDQAGTTGLALRLEAFGVRLFNRPEDMDVEYRAYVADKGWQEWRSSGAPAGTYGEDREIWAIEMRLVNPYPGSVFTYSAHIANQGWVYYASDDPARNQITLGDPRLKWRLEAIRADVANSLP
jgi:uncharacterized protein YjdB